MTGSGSCTSRKYLRDRNGDRNGIKLQWRTGKTPGANPNSNRVERNTTLLVAGLLVADILSY